MRSIFLLLIFLVTLIVAEDRISKPFVQFGVLEDFEDFKTTKSYVVIANLIIDKESGRLLKSLGDSDSCIKIDDKMAVGINNSGVYFLDLTQNRVVKNIKGEFYNVALNGDKLIYNKMENSDVVVYNLKSGKRERVITASSKDYRAEYISENYVVFNKNKTSKIIDLKSGSLIKVIKDREYIFSKGGYIVLAKEIKDHYEVELRDIKKDKIVKVFRVGDISDFNVEDIHNSIFIFRKNKKLKFWDIKKRDYIYREFSLKPDENFLGIDNNLIYFMASSGDVLRFNISTGEKSVWFPKSKESISAIGFNGKYLAVASRNTKTIYIFDTENGKLYRILKAVKSLEDIFKINFQKEYLLISEASNFYIYNFENKKIAKTFPTENKNSKKGGAVAVAIYKDSLAVGFENGEIDILNLSGDEVLESYFIKKSPKDEFSSIAVIAFDSNYIAVGMEKPNGERLILIDRKNGRKKVISKKFLSNLYPLTLKDGKLIFGYMDQSTIRVVQWSIKDRKVDKVLLNSTPPGSESDALLRGFGEKFVVYEFEGDHTGIYDKKSGKFIADVPSLWNFFTVYGDKIVGFKYKPLVHLFDLESRKILASFYILGNKNWITMTPEGYFVGSRGAKNYVNITKFYQTSP